MKRLANYLFFLDQNFRLQRTIPVKNIQSLYEEEEFVSDLFNGLLTNHTELIDTLNKQKVSPKVEQIGLRMGNKELTMEIQPLVFTAPMDSVVLISFFEEPTTNGKHYLNNQSVLIPKINNLDEFNHEIKNSVNIIQGISDLMAESSEKEIKDIVPSLQSSVRHLRNLTLNYLLNRKHEKGKWDRVSFNPRQEINELLNQFSYLEKSKHATITPEFDEELPEKLMGDPSTLKQVLINLIFNAREHQPEGNIKVGVELKSKDLDEVSLIFYVQDFGNGIPQEVVDSLATDHHYSSQKGFGLGLKICREILLSLGSDLRIGSKLQKGTRFEFTLNYLLQLPQKKGKGKIELEDEPLDKVQKRALIVDDEHLNRLLATKSLTKLGYHCEPASNGVIALHKLQENEFDLVLLDVHLPILDGISLYNLIHRKYPRLRVIFSSGSTSIEQLESLKELNNVDFLPKPYSLSELKEVLEKQ